MRSVLFGQALSLAKQTQTAGTSTRPIEGQRVRTSPGPKNTGTPSPSWARANLRSTTIASGAATGRSKRPTCTTDKLSTLSLSVINWMDFARFLISPNEGGLAAFKSLVPSHLIGLVRLSGPPYLLPVHPQSPSVPGNKPNECRLHQRRGQRSRGCASPRTASFAASKSCH